MRFFFSTALAGLLLSLAVTVFAADEDGYDLWLRYRPVSGAAQAAVKSQARSIVLPGGAGGKCSGFVYGVSASGDTSDTSGRTTGTARFIEIDVTATTSSSPHTHTPPERCRSNTSG